MSTEAITMADSKRFIALETIIKEGKAKFIEVGKALAEIRDSRLYRGDFETFEEYCANRWNFARAHAYRLIDAAEVGVSPIGDKVKNEAQARELSRVPKGKRAKVMKMAHAHAAANCIPVTAKMIAQAAEAVANKPKPESAWSAPEPEPEPQPVTITFEAFKTMIEQACSRVQEGVDLTKYILVLSVEARKLTNLQRLRHPQPAIQLGAYTR